MEKMEMMIVILTSAVGSVIGICVACLLTGTGITNSFFEDGKMIVKYTVPGVIAVQVVIKVLGWIFL